MAAGKAEALTEQDCCWKQQAVGQQLCFELVD